ncbi:MAG: capsule assembly Wzi family protein [Acidobacteriaceae bacterium]
MAKNIFPSILSIGLLVSIALGPATCTGLAQQNSAKDQTAPLPTVGKVNVSDPDAASIGGDFKRTIKGILADQKMIWLSPFHVTASDAAWLVPDAGITAGLLATDRTTSHELTRNSHTKTFASFSTAGAAALGGSAALIYFVGVRNSDNHMRETGILSAEAAVDAFEVDEGLKYVFRRERPNLDNGRGRFFQSVNSASFPSSHSAISFAIASVIADEYPGWLTKTLAYGTASAVAFARVAGQQHFPTDVFVGATAGYLIGHNVVKQRHVSDYTNYGTFVREEEPIPAARMSSTYVELDSWIYPAVERLTALGVIGTSYMGMRPWTRMSVYGMVANIDDVDLSPEAEKLVTALRAELKREEDLDRNGSVNDAIGVDRIYTRIQHISGTPLNDSFHFGSTIVDDFGRPFGSGTQEITGFESRAEKGRFSFYVRGEYQHTPTIPGYSDAVNGLIARVDNIPGETFAGVQSRDQFRLLDTYASLNLLSNEISVGKQSFFWGPDDSTSLMMSNNAEPIYALRINRTLPLVIPLLSKLTGPIRYDNFFGKLAGTHYPPNPFMYGQKLSIHPTPNLEFGFSRNATFAGRGLEPLTFHTFIKSFTSVSSGTAGNFNPRDTPGSRHTNFDFRYRLPFVRDWLTLYADSFAHDDVSPLDSPRRAAVVPGIYLSKFPGIPKLDVHVEGGTTDTVTTRAEGGNFYYYESLYKDSYTNKRNLLGSWIGREGTGGQAWATYWFNPQSTLMAGFRTVKVSQLFIPQGETQQDAYGELNYLGKSGFGVQVLLQQERWVAPVLAAGAQHDFTARLQVSFDPKDWRLSRKAVTP